MANRDINKQGKELLKKAIAEINLLTQHKIKTMDMFYRQSSLRVIYNDLSISQKQIIIKQIREYLIEDKTGINEDDIKEIIYKFLDNDFEITRKNFIGNTKKLNLGFFLSLRFLFKKKDHLGRGFEQLFNQNTEYIIERLKRKTQQNSSIPLRIASIIPTRNGNDLSLISRKIIDEFGNIDGVLNEISANIGTKSRMGSMIPVLEKDKKIYEDFTTHKSSLVRKRAEDNIKSIIKQIEHEEIREEERRL